MNKFTKVGIFSTVGGAAIMLGALSGAFVAGAADPGPAPEIASADLSVNSVAAFPMNDRGQTYGYVDQGLANNPDARADLVAVTTDKGVDGWAYYDELQPAAAAVIEGDIDRAQKLSATGAYRVSVYKLDGKSLVGYQTVNRP